MGLGPGVWLSGPQTLLAEPLVAEEGRERGRRPCFRGRSWRTALPHPPSKLTRPQLHTWTGGAAGGAVGALHTWTRRLGGGGKALFKEKK